MKDSDFITIRDDGIFLGDKPTVAYRDIPMDKYTINGVRADFNDLREIMPTKFKKLYVLTSETCGEYAVCGDPSEKPGPYIWVRSELFDGTKSPWVYANRAINGSVAARTCARVAISALLHRGQNMRGQLHRIVFGNIMNVR